MHIGYKRVFIKKWKNIFSSYGCNHF
jgi:hypothetical protein